MKSHIQNKGISLSSKNSLQEKSFCGSSYNEELGHSEIRIKKHNIEFGYLNNTYNLSGWGSPHNLNERKGQFFDISNGKVVKRYSS